MSECTNTINIFDKKIPKAEELYKTIRCMDVYENMEDFSELKKYENLISLNIDTVSSNIALLTLKNALNELKRIRMLEIGIDKNVDFELFGVSECVTKLKIRAKYENNICELRKLGCDMIDWHINKEFDVKTLKDWKRLNVLSIQFPKVKNLEYLEYLRNLEVLEIYDNCFDDIQWLSNLHELKYLYIIRSNNFPKVIYDVKLKNPNVIVITENSKESIKEEYFNFRYDK